MPSIQQLTPNHSSSELGAAGEICKFLAGDLRGFLIETDLTEDIDTPENQSRTVQRNEYILREFGKNAILVLSQAGRRGMSQAIQRLRGGLIDFPALRSHPQFQTLHRNENDELHFVSLVDGSSHLSDISRVDITPSFFLSSDKNVSEIGKETQDWFADDILGLNYGNILAWLSRNANSTLIKHEFPANGRNERIIFVGSQQNLRWKAEKTLSRIQKGVI